MLRLLELMLPKNDLHELICCLSQGEKRYFQLFAQRHAKNGQPNYLLLFKAILNQPQYDETELLQEFSGTAMARNFSSEKVQLFAQILRAMREFHRGKDIDSQLGELMGEIRFLKEKRMYKRALKHLHKARKKARLYERYTVLMELIQLEQNLRKEIEPKGIAESMRRLMGERRAIMALISEQMEYIQLYDRLFLLVRKEFRIKNSGWQKEFETLFKQPLLKAGTEGRTFFSRLYYLLTYALFHQLRGEHALAHPFFSKAVELWDAFPHFKSDNPQNFQRSLFNFLGSCHMVEDYEPFPAVLVSIRAISAKTPNEKAVLFGTAYYNELLFFLATGRLNEAVQKVPEIEKGLEKFGRKLNRARILGFHYNLMVLFFLRGNFSMALKWLNKIINRPEVEIRLDIQRLCRIYELVIHFEMDNRDLLEYRFRSVLRQFFRKEKEDEFGRLVLHFLKEAFVLPAGIKQQGLMKRWYRKLNELDANQHSGVSELLIWLHSKIHEIPIKKSAISILSKKETKS